MKNKITKDSYELVPDVDTVDKSAIYTVRLKQEPYESVVVVFGKVKLMVQEDQETAKLSFKYEILEGDKQALEADKYFPTYVGDVLAFIIQDAFDSGNYQLGDPAQKSSDVKSTSDDDPSEGHQR